MELEELIKKRTSVREFEDKDVPISDIRKMIDSARLAPSGKNIQGWHYVAIKNKRTIKDLEEIVEEENNRICKKLDPEKAKPFKAFFEKFTKFFAKAPLVITVFAKDYIPSGYNELCEIGEKDYAEENLIKYRNPGLQGIGASIEHLYLTAVDMGYGMCWLTSANYAGRQIEKYLRDKKIFENEKYYFVALLTIGKEKGESKQLKKKDIEDVLTIVE